ncbi:MAG: hypothetical protein V1724_09645 [Chloroflexota bacterium]
MCFVAAAQADLGAIFRVSTEKLGDKVAWQELSDVLGAVYVLPSMTERQFHDLPLVPPQTAYFVLVSSDLAGHTLAAFLNSLPVRVFCSSFAESARSAYYRYFSWVLGMLPLPEDVRRLLSVRQSSVPRPLQRVLKVSRSLHSDLDRPDREALKREVNGRPCRYAIRPGRRRLQALHAFYGFIRANPQGRPSSLPQQDSELAQDDVWSEDAQAWAVHLNRI